MATKKTNVFPWNKVAGFLAFFALLIAGVSFLLSKIGGSLGIFTMVGSLMLTASVIISGWRFLKTTKLPGNRLIWTIVFWVFAILCIVGCIVM